MRVRLGWAAALLLPVAATPVDAPVLVIAHRGASAHAPEHTLVAYDLGLAQGADAIEQDLQMTRDGVLVVLHDATLDRTAGPACRGRVAERTLAELRACRVGAWFNVRRPARARPAFDSLGIPTLDEVFARYRDTVRYYIETKHPEEAPGMERALVAALDRHRLRAHAHRGGVLVQSFSETSLRTLHALDPALPLVQLLGETPRDSVPARLARARGLAVGVGPWRGDVDQAFVDAAHRACLVVHPYTVNDTTEMRRLVALGVDGMFTDEPGLLRRVVDAAARRIPAGWSPRRC